MISDHDFKLLIHFADEHGDGHIANAHPGLASQIVYARDLTPQFDLSKWIVASRVIMGRVNVLEKIMSHMDLIKDAL